MRILIDGDACPNRKEVIDIAKQYHVEVIVFVDYAHMLNDDCQIIQCDVGRDSVDMMIMNSAQSQDLVITQDYGLASLLLMKNVKVLHVSGKMITHENIDELLTSRYLSAMQRKQNKHLKGPSKRTKEVENDFLKQLQYLIETAI